MRLGLPDLDQSKAAVLGSLRSPESQRGYRHSIEEFIDGYCGLTTVGAVYDRPYFVESRKNGRS